MQNTRPDPVLSVLASYNENNSSDEEQYVVNPASFVIATAYAKPKKAIADKLIAKIKEVTKSIDLEDAGKVSKALSKILKDPKLKTIAASGTSALRMLAVLGGAKIAKFTRDSKNWRVNRWLVLFSLIYLAEEADAERLDITEESHFTSLVSHLFSKNKSNYNGAVFQIVQTAYFHALHQVDDTKFPKVTGIDAVRAAYYLKNGVRTGIPYKRQVDIVLEYPDQTEEWVELKSYSNKTISGSVKPKDKVFAGANIFREFFHDYRLNDSFITSDPENKPLILKVGVNPTKTNNIFTWYFQSFAPPKGAGNTGQKPSEKQIKTVRKKLCNKPTDVRIEDYQYNFENTRSTVEKKCLTKADKQVELRDTDSYFKEVLDIIGSDFALAIQSELLGID